MPTVDLKAIREQLQVQDPADPASSAFLRFVMRLSEALDRDVSPGEYPQLVTLSGSIAWLHSTFSPSPRP